MEDGSAPRIQNPAELPEPSLSHLIIGKNLLRQQGLARALQQAYLQGKYGQNLVSLVQFRIAGATYCS